MMDKVTTKKQQLSNKKEFAEALARFVSGLGEYVSVDDGQWTVKGFIDIYKTIYTISSDTKIVSKILEIHLFPKILQFAEDNGYSILSRKTTKPSSSLLTSRLRTETRTFPGMLMASPSEVTVPTSMTGRPARTSSSPI